MKTWVQTGLGLLETDRLTAGSLNISDADREILQKECRRGEARLISGASTRYLAQPLGSTEKGLECE